MLALSSLSYPEHNSTSLSAAPSNPFNWITHNSETVTIYVKGVLLGIECKSYKWTGCLFTIHWYKK
jgi:hypothetical protein